MLLPIIPRRVHGIIDYVVGIVLIAAPWLFNFTDNRPAMTVPICLGVATILYSLITDYELGLVHILPMRVHLWIDLLSGLMLAASPWLFGFANRIVWPHLTVGLMEIVIVLITASLPVLDTSDATSHGNMGNPGTI